MDIFRLFLQNQNLNWELSAKNYIGLVKVEEKCFEIEGRTVKVQFNPERIRSSAAKVDRDSIAARKCFLCTDNRPAEQNSMNLDQDFILLVNPFPIFNCHFTIPSLLHTEQLLLPGLNSLFEISARMKGYTLFYNGPECGASAPDHLHFQAGENGFMPVEEEFELLRNQDDTLLFHSENLKIRAFGQYLRKMISFETNAMEAGIQSIRAVLSLLGELQPGKAEPMINLLCYFKDNKWIVHLFPRQLHRPRQFYCEGIEQLLISPASVDFGGVLITPRREDFDKITARDITDIFSQVSLNEEQFQAVKNSIREFRL
jgi:ATP adenylyltransferase/5',5'''-P-1,P-4-tetraphosphate phosphorylase II